jgi:hypothetical protein
LAQLGVPTREAGRRRSLSIRERTGKLCAIPRLSHQLRIGLLTGSCCGRIGHVRAGVAMSSRGIPGAAHTNEAECKTVYGQISR